MSICFVADNHFEQRPGYHQWQVLQRKLTGARFFEDDYSVFTETDFAQQTELLILNCIGSTGPAGHAPDCCSAQVRAYCEMGKPLLLLHGASAAFWQWDWWRPAVGLRWVRHQDPDQRAPSFHPQRPFSLRQAPAAPAWATVLEEVDLPHDEIYMNLYPEAKVDVLLETSTDEGIVPQAYSWTTPWGGKAACYLPGHYPTVSQHPSTIHNISCLIDWCLTK